MRDEAPSLHQEVPPSSPGGKVIDRSRYPMPSVVGPRGQSGKWGRVRRPSLAFDRVTARRRRWIIKSMKKKLPSLTLVLGGAGSGKSRFAEDLVSATGCRRHYIATAQAFDAEMKEKIAAHQRQRGPDWITHEAPDDVAPALQAAEKGDIVLLDCATLWLSNQLLAERVLDVEIAKFLDAVRGCTAPLVVVSNEVGQGVVPEYKMGRAFRNAQGRLNQALATESDLAVFVIAGLPQVLKGTLP
ncbi:MAG: bifunctional adenosylcobinamide kinase/adenosylcobinamide-phosphate guanylyltransferase [Pseudomonadota bacterium]